MSIKILFFTVCPFNYRSECKSKLVIKILYLQYLLVYIKNNNLNSVQLSSEFNRPQICDVGLTLTLCSTTMKHELLLLPLKMFLPLFKEACWKTDFGVKLWNEDR